MSRNLDSTLASHLADPHIQPCIFAELTFKSGVERVWTGVGDIVGPDGNTFSGLGMFAKVGSLSETTDVKAAGTTVTLSGIGDSLIDIPSSGVTPPDPPFDPPAGQSVSWAIATVAPTAVSFDIPPSIWNSYLGNSGAASGTLSTGTLTLTNGNPIEENSVTLDWSGFTMPLEIPAGAEITGIYPVFVLSSLASGGEMDVGVSGGDTIALPTLAVGSNVLPNQSSLPEALEATIGKTLEGAASLGMDISFVGVAIYYVGSARTKMSMLQEALGDVFVGGPAKLWFGLLSNSSPLGTPYLYFAGTVDKPTVHVGADTLSITLALENRLVNLQRANQRRYTAADQHLSYPDDLGFNWVEILQDIALVWG